MKIEIIGMIAIILIIALVALFYQNSPNSNIMIASDVYGCHTNDITGSIDVILYLPDVPNKPPVSDIEASQSVANGNSECTYSLSTKTPREVYKNWCRSGFTESGTKVECPGWLFA